MMVHLFTSALAAAESGRLPDVILRFGIRRLLKQRLRSLIDLPGEELAHRKLQFVAQCRISPVALVPQLANEQHYEVPAEFFQAVLGERLKYSCCHWDEGVDSLHEAEESALRSTCERAQLADGMDVLELGCGWGSLSLWMAERFPNSRITSVSNSASQRQFIEAEAGKRGLCNLTVVTSDMNTFATQLKFDRVVSVEMFEHMRNHEELLRRIAGWLNPQGKLFVHIFCHREQSYLFEDNGPADWMSRHFFSGGMMPSQDLLATYQQGLQLSRQWQWNGQHYERTSNAWLQRLDENRDALLLLFGETYGGDHARQWLSRWRLFFMACAELFGYDDGNEWFVSHYLFEKS